VIKLLRPENGYEAKTFIKKFLSKNWSQSSSNKLLTKTDQTCTVDCKRSSGRKSKTRITQNVDLAKKRFLLNYSYLFSCLFFYWDMVGHACISRL